MIIKLKESHHKHREVSQYETIKIISISATAGYITFFVRLQPLQPLLPHTTYSVLSLSLPTTWRTAPPPYSSTPPPLRSKGTSQTRLLPLPFFCFHEYQGAYIYYHCRTAEFKKLGANHTDITTNTYYYYY